MAVSPYTNKGTMRRGDRVVKSCCILPVSLIICALLLSVNIPILSGLTKKAQVSHPTESQSMAITGTLRS